MSQNICQLTNPVLGVIELGLQILYHGLIVLPILVLYGGSHLALALHLDQCLTRLVNVVNRADDLAHLLVVCILPLDFVLEVLL